MKNRLIGNPKSFSRTNLIVFVLTFAVIGGIILLITRAAGTTANLWIDTNGGTCTRSASPVAYNDASACSWSAANSACQSNDVVIVKGGNYPNQLIRGSNGRTNYCNIYTANSETVTTGEFDMGTWRNTGCTHGASSTTTTNWVKITGPIKTTLFSADCSDHIYVDTLDMDNTTNHSNSNQPFSAQIGTTNFTLLNSKVHDALNPNAMAIFEGSNFLIDHNDFYNDENNTNGAIHEECVRFQPATNVTFTRNHIIPQRGRCLCSSRWFYYAP
jgi:hypothetical protein